jgi:hypothetical protein
MNHWACALSAHLRQRCRRIIGVSVVSHLAENYRASLRENRHERLSRLDDAWKLVPSFLVVSKRDMKSAAVLVTKVGD